MASAKSNFHHNDIEAGNFGSMAFHLANRDVSFHDIISNFICCTPPLENGAFFHINLNATKLFLLHRLPRGMVATSVDLALGSR